MNVKKIIEEVTMTDISEAASCCTTTILNEEDEKESLSIETSDIKRVMKKRK